MKPDRNTLLILVVIIASLLLIFLVNQEKETDQYEQNVPPWQNKTIEEKNGDKEFEQDTPNGLVSMNVCEGCHMSGKSSVPQALTAPPHQNGGTYCLSCHVINHEKHPMSNGVNCDSCHTGSEKPAYFNGSIPCNNCHNYPDALSPSGGNIITIHRPRDVSCNKCHTDDCNKCHAEMGSSARWEKRLGHFKVVARGR